MGRGKGQCDPLVQGTKGIYRKGLASEDASNEELLGSEPSHTQHEAQKESATAKGLRQRLKDSKLSPDARQLIPKFLLVAQLVCVDARTSQESMGH